MFDSNEIKYWKQYRKLLKTTDSYRILYDAIAEIVRRRFAERQSNPLKTCVIINPGQLILGQGFKGMMSIQSMVNLFHLAAFTCIREAIDAEQRAFTLEKVQAFTYLGNSDPPGTQGIFKSTDINILPNLDTAYNINDSFVYIKEALPAEIVKILHMQPAAILWEKIAMQEHWAQGQQEIVDKFFQGSQVPVAIPLMAGARPSNSGQGVQFTKQAYLQWRLPGNPEYNTNPTSGFQPDSKTNNGDYDLKPPASETFLSQLPPRPPNSRRPQLPRPTTIRNFLSRGRTQDARDTSLSEKPYG